MTEPIKELALQEIFDRVALHLLTQGTAAVDPGRGMCKYRTDAGLKCAVGGLIPDDLYDPRIEGAAVVDYTMAEPLERDELLKETLMKIGIKGNGFALLKSLQRIHDLEAGDFGVNHRFVWAAQLTELAEKKGLNYDVVTNFKLR